MLQFLQRPYIIAILLVSIIIGMGTLPLRTKANFHTPSEIHSLRALMSSGDGFPRGRDSLFGGSGLCGGCHGHDPNGIAFITPSGEDVNILDDWAGTIMANSAFDPFWRAKVSHEILVNPNHSLDIQTKCTSCHAPLGHYNAMHNGATNYTMAQVRIDSLALDGVSCGACHSIKDSLIGLRFSGQQFYQPNHTVYGPYINPFTGPMQQFIGFNVRYGEHISDAGLCAGCHSLVTKTIDLQGNYTGQTFVEQATYHEWLNSDYGNSAEPVSCQSCHIPQINDNIVIAANYAFLAPRRPYGKHHLVGGNTTMLKLMRENIDSLGIYADPKHFDSTLARTTRLLKTQTIDLALTQTATTPDSLFFNVKIMNKAGHKFPSGYPSRRAFVTFVVLKANGDTLFRSGTTNPSTYEVLGENNTFEPHHTIINNSSQAQIYEMIMGDVNNNVTTVLARAATHLKDNRLPPLGFNTSHYAYDSTKIVGAAATDPNFNKANDGTQGNATDIVHYHVPTNGYTGAVQVVATVNYQTMPYRYMQEMFSYSSYDINKFKTMYNAADRTPFAVATATLESLVSTNQENIALPIILYPNPSDDEVRINNYEQLGIADIRIYDATGKLQSHLQGNSFNGILKLPTAKGHYFIEVLSTDKKRYTAKIVKK